MVCLCFIKYTKENMSGKCSTINSTFLLDVYNMISKMTCGYEEELLYLPSTIACFLSQQLFLYAIHDQQPSEPVSSSSLALE
jgi:hypothetical protein